MPTDDPCAAALAQAGRRRCRPARAGRRPDRHRGDDGAAGGAHPAGPDRTHHNPLGSVHGGWFATLRDSARGCAVHTTLPPGKGYTTLELKLNIVRAIGERVPLERAEGRVVHGGEQGATAEARRVGHDGKLYARGSTTCLIFDARG